MAAAVQGRLYAARWDIYVGRLAGERPATLARDVGVSLGTMTRYLANDMGFPPNRVGRPVAGRNPRGSSDPARRAGMIAAREAGRTLEDIGNEYGVTREWVRQVLSDAGLVGLKKVAAAKRRQEWIEQRPTCLGCGKPVIGHSKEGYCSRTCRRNHKAARPTPALDAKAREILALRRSGMMWKEIAAHTGRNIATVYNDLIRWALKTGTNVDDCFPRGGPKNFKSFARYLPPATPPAPASEAA